MKLNTNERPSTEAKNVSEAKSLKITDLVVNSALNVARLFIIISPIILECFNKGRGNSKNTFDNDFKSSRY